MGSGHAKYILRCGKRGMNRIGQEMKMADKVELNHRCTALTVEFYYKVHFFGAQTTSAHAPVLWQVSESHFD